MKKRMFFCVVALIAAMFVLSGCGENDQYEPAENYVSNIEVEGAVHEVLAYINEVFREMTFENGQEAKNALEELYMVHLVPLFSTNDGSRLVFNIETVANQEPNTFFDLTYDYVGEDGNSAILSNTVSSSVHGASRNWYHAVFWVGYVR